ncbi:MAG: hypothetical protein IH971_08570 [Candidatus Marinimicrobia bacterium]|nr:hypothetical protein [Candidatus Neomarinimicrobiota bacterium]
MSRKPTKLIGLSLSALDSLLLAGQELNLQPARLIPFHKPGDELALASIFLSALRLVKEFRNHIFQTIGLSRSNRILIYTEAEFLLFDKKRIDGLILVIRANTIIDAVLIEVKNKHVELDSEQIQHYVNIAKEYGIPKLLTISNQFVSFPTQSPINIKTPKYVSTYHISWSYLLTIAHILLTENENNIASADQVEIMREVVEYFESGNSGILGFTQMKPGWVELTQKANAGTALKLTDSFVEETVSSWLQEERDIALILSRELGLLVRSGQRKFKSDLSDRINYEKKKLVSKKLLESSLHIEGTASPLQIRAYFDRKNIEMSSTLSAPQDKKTRGQISWIRNQLRQAEKKNPQLFAHLAPDLLIEIHLKFVKDPLRVHVGDLDMAAESIGSREIKGFSILYLKYLGRKFESRKGIVAIIEKTVIEYYQGILQHLKRWEKPAPQIVKKAEENEAI